MRNHRCHNRFSPSKTCFFPSKTGFFPCFPHLKQVFSMFSHRSGWVTWSAEMSGLLGLGLHRRSAAAWRFWLGIFRKCYMGMDQYLFLYHFNGMNSWDLWILIAGYGSIPPFWKPPYGYGSIPMKIPF